MAYGNLDDKALNMARKMTYLLYWIMLVMERILPSYCVFGLTRRAWPLALL